MDVTEHMTATDYRAMIGAPEPEAGRLRTGTAEQAIAQEHVRMIAHRFAHEDDFQRWLRARAAEWGWLYSHNGDSRRSDPGFPDTVLVNGPHGCCAELKMPGKHPKPAQVLWLDALARLQFRIRCQFTCLWYPEHEGDILAYLADPAHVEPPNVWVPRGP